VDQLIECFYFTGKVPGIAGIAEIDKQGYPDCQ
jgi:predicted RNA-binding protein with PUA-like domain